VLRDQFSAAQAAEFDYLRGITTFPLAFYEIRYWLVITSIFQFKFKLAKLSDKTANLLKSTDYFSNQQNSTATQTIFPPLMMCSLISDY